MPPMPAEAEAVHGLSDAFLADKPMFGGIVSGLLDFVGDARLVAHNAEFDRRFLNWELRNCGRDQIPLERVDCTLVLARRKFPGAKHSLDALCARFGVDLSEREKHGALLDAQLLARVYVELQGGRQIGMALAAADSPREEVVVERRIWPARPHAPSEAERERHTAFIGRLKNALWLRFSNA